MPSRLRQRQPSGLEPLGSDKADPAACILAFFFPEEKARANPTWQALLAADVSHAIRWMVFGHPVACVIWENTVMWLTPGVWVVH